MLQVNFLVNENYAFSPVDPSKKSEFRGERLDLFGVALAKRSRPPEQVILAATNCFISLLQPSGMNEIKPFSADHSCSKEVTNQITDKLSVKLSSRQKKQTFRLEKEKTNVRGELC
jgi:hypothetical protein